jgi:hypothetical protein
VVSSTPPTPNDLKLLAESRASCANCGAGLSGPWCASCGQRVLEGRHTLRGFARAGVGHVLDVDRGFLHTAMQLTAAPGRVIREFIAGVTERYTHPVAYLLVAFAAFAVTGRLAGGEAGLADGSNRVITATAVPVIAAAARAVFWRAGLNYAEHLIATMYLLGHVVLALAAVQAVTPLVSLQVSSTLGLVALVGGAGYFCLGYGRLFPRRSWVAAAGGFAALATGLALWTVALVQIVAVFRRASEL